MKTVRPKPLDAKATSLRLTPEEGFVLSRIDGTLSVRDLVALTGIDEGRVEQIVTKLAATGAVQVESDDATTSLADFAAVLGMDPTAFGGERATSDSAGRSAATSAAPPPEHASVPTLDPDVDAVTAEEGAAGAEELPPADDATEPAASEDDVIDEAQERNYRQIYETRFHILPVDARTARAKTASGTDLLALCLDQDARVVAGILENPHVGLDHVRMLAFYHRTGTGLEMLTRRQDWLHDAQVERRMLRNPQMPETVLARIMSSKQLLQTYKILVDRELPELTRTRARGHLRKKWQSSPAEDRADLMLRTEGRPLAYMTGCTFDARTTQIICGKTITSMLLIQNFAKFPATPPSILAHVIKQPFVRKNPGLKKLLLQHPNMPGEVKRSI